MDPAQFGYSTLPMQHAPYDAISPKILEGANAGKVALITGAGQGIGAAISASLARSGANIAILDLTMDKLTQTKQTCELFAGRVQAYAADVTDAVRIKEICDQVEQDLGQIVILVNNAGILDQRPFIMSTFDAFWRQIEDEGAWAGMHHQYRLAIWYRRRAHDAGLCDVQGRIDSRNAYDGLDPAIHMYALHPGGVLTGMGGAGAATDVKEKYGDITDEEYYTDLFKDGPPLCGQTCAWLVSGKGTELRGLFLDCRQHAEKLLSIGRETLLRENRNKLTVNFIDGYCNEP